MCNITKNFRKTDVIELPLANTLDAAAKPKKPAWRAFLQTGSIFVCARGCMPFCLRLFNEFSSGGTFRRFSGVFLCPVKRCFVFFLRRGKGIPVLVSSHNPHYVARDESI